MDTKNKKRTSSNNVRGQPMSKRKLSFAKKKLHKAIGKRVSLDGRPISFIGFKLISINGETAIIQEIDGVRKHTFDLSTLVSFTISTNHLT